MQTLWLDLRYGIRQLRRSPRFAALACLTLALGIGGNTAIFSVVNGVVFQPLPFPEPERIAIVWETDQARDSTRSSVSYPNFRDWQERNAVFASMALFRDSRVNFTTEQGTERIPGATVTADFLSILGVQPILGRAFLPQDDLQGAASVVLLTHEFWGRRFGADPEVVGKTMTLDGAPSEIIGVLPARFSFPVEVADAEVWIPAASDAPYFFQRGLHAAKALVRLETGISLHQAQTAMNTIAAQLAEEYPRYNRDRGINLVPLHEQVTGEARRLLLMLLGVACFVLLIACANLANLLLARGTGRRAEFCIRRALGAGWKRLVRQSLTESALIGVIGGTLGALAAPLVVGLLRPRLAAWNIPRLTEVSVDGWALGFTATLALVSTLFFGLLPALKNVEGDLAASLKDGGRTGQGSSRHRIQALLITGEVALVVVLLIGSGLLVRSFIKLIQVDAGFDTRNVLSFQLLASSTRHATADQLTDFFHAALTEVRALPGVLAAGASTTVPLAGGTWGTSFHILSRMNPDTDEGHPFHYYSATPDYFETMKIPLLRGTLFTDEDRRHRPGAVVISDTTARRYWPRGDPLGEQIKLSIGLGGEGEPDTFEIVGVVGDVRHTSLDSSPTPQMYVSYRQQTNSMMNFVVRTIGDPLDLTASVRATISSIDPDAAVDAIGTLDTYKRRSAASRRLAVALLTSFSVLALALAAVGLYGVVSHLVNQRSREFGVRMALGAQTPDILGLVLRQGLGPTAIGIVLGTGGGLALTRLLRSLLFGVSSLDPLTFAGTALLLLLVALLACVGPARRAAYVDPWVALRYE